MKRIWQCSNLVHPIKKATRLELQDTSTNSKTPADETLLAAGFPQTTAQITDLMLGNAFSAVIMRHEDSARPLPEMVIQNNADGQIIVVSLLGIVSTCMLEAGKGVRMFARNRFNRPVMRSKAYRRVLWKSR